MRWSVGDEGGRRLLSLYRDTVLPCWLLLLLLACFGVHGLAAGSLHGAGQHNPCEAYKTSPCRAIPSYAIFVQPVAVVDHLLELLLSHSESCGRFNRRCGCDFLHRPILALVCRIRLEYFLFRGITASRSPCNFNPELILKSNRINFKLVANRIELIHIVPEGDAILGGERDGLLRAHRERLGHALLREDEVLLRVEGESSEL